MISCAWEKGLDKTRERKPPRDITSFSLTAKLARQQQDGSAGVSKTDC